MDIEEFYSENPARRSSEELTFGLNWSSALDSGLLWDLFWVRDTGELYLMSKPAPGKWLPLVAGSRHPRHHRMKTAEPTAADIDERADDDLGVEVLAMVDSEDKVKLLLDGWLDAIKSPDGIAWLRKRVRPAA